MIEKIISGGQTGVDQAALLVAQEKGIPIGGWCPIGGLDENNECIFDKYALTEVTGLSFKDSIAERTKRNIHDSDGTLIIVPCIPLPETIKDGTLLTIEYAEAQSKPYLLVALADAEESAACIHAWVEENNIKVLNVAGPRESSYPSIYEKTCNLFKHTFSSLALKPTL